MGRRRPIRRMERVVTYPNETNSIALLTEEQRRAHKIHASGPVVDWADPGLARIVRLRLLGEAGYPAWDVSYCMGVMSDGRRCMVSLPFSRLPRRRWKAAICEYAKADGVFAKGLGVFDQGCVSRLW